MSIYKIAAAKKKIKYLRRNYKANKSPLNLQKKKKLFNSSNMKYEQIWAVKTDDQLLL